jgi:hypothetical protein
MLRPARHAELIAASRVARFIRERLFLLPARSGSTSELQTFDEAEQSGVRFRPECPWGVMRFRVRCLSAGSACR